MGGSVKSRRTTGAARIPVVVLLATPCAILAILVGSGPAAASITGSATMQLSGAGHGTLHEGPQGLCTTARDEGVDLIGLIGAVSGFKKAATWTLVVASQSTKAGTYRVRASGSPGGQLDPIVAHASEAQSQAAILNSTSGTYTVKGVKGTLDVTFGSGKKAIRVKGSWNCSS
jgi:hypothetical protein